MILLTALTASAYQPLSTCGGTPTHWNDATVWHVTKPSGQQMYSQISDADVVDAFEGGFQVWHDTISCCSGFDHSYGGEVSSYYSTNDNTNVISFQESNWDWSLGSQNGVIAVTFSQWAGGCALTDGDMVYNAVGFDFTTTDSPGGGDTDLQSISAHENGHWTGLDHSGVNSATMWPSYTGGIGFRALHDDDEAGVCNAHPSDCGPEEEDCSDGIDDEPDGMIDCDDPDCTGELVCMCPVEGVLACDGQVSGSTSGGSNTVEDWGCADWSTTGPEAVYSFSSAVAGPVTVRLTGLTADLDMFVTDDGNGRCDSNNCDSSGSPNTESEEVTIQAQAGVTYVVVADGYEGATSSYTIELDCPDGGAVPPPPPPPEDIVCAPIGALTCGVPVAGNTQGRPNEIEAYACTPEINPGPESVYSITPTVDGPVTVDIYDLSADLDLRVTEAKDGGCDSASCVGASDTPDLGPEQLTFDGIAGATYMVVADGHAGSTGSFTMLASCGGSEVPPGSEPAVPADGGADNIVDFRPVGCSCDSGGATAAFSVLPLLMLGLRRRRR